MLMSILEIIKDILGILHDKVPATIYILIVVVFATLGIIHWVMFLVKYYKDLAKDESPNLSNQSDPVNKPLFKQGNIIVPSSCPTIQKAVRKAKYDDTIIIEDGIYTVCRYPQIFPSHSNLITGIINLVLQTGVYILHFPLIWCSTIVINKTITIMAKDSISVDNNHDGDNDNYPVTIINYGAPVFRITGGAPVIKNIKIERKPFCSVNFPLKEMFSFITGVFYSSPVIDEKNGKADYSSCRLVNSKGEVSPKQLNSHLIESDNEISNQIRIRQSLDCRGSAHEGKFLKICDPSVESLSPFKTFIGDSDPWDTMIDKYRKYGVTQKTWYDDCQSHEVQISTFYMSDCAVTRKQFLDFIDDAQPKSLSSRNHLGWGFDDGWREMSLDIRSPSIHQEDDHPVVCVSWSDADQYIRWLNSQSNTFKESYLSNPEFLNKETIDWSKWEFRLPTEAEWEFACRSGQTTDFHWGDNPDEGREYMNAANLIGSPSGKPWNPCLHYTGYYIATAPVRSLLPNRFGLYHMQGNVWEWCYDYYSESFYSDGRKDNPSGPDSGTQRVLRGGSWGNGAWRCRAGYRRHEDPDYVACDVGFRLVFARKIVNGMALEENNL